jgi:hypothetical protein
MARIKLLLAAENPKVPVLGKGLRRIGQPNCRLRGYGDCAKIEVPAVAGKLTESAFAGSSRFGSENQTQA